MTKKLIEVALPLEAQRLGLDAYASDLNPVAVLINKAMIEIPPKFAGRPPVNPGSAGLPTGYRFTVRTGKPADPEAAKNGTKLARGANFRCLMSGSPIPPDDTKTEGKAGRMGARMMPGWWS